MVRMVRTRRSRKRKKGINEREKAIIKFIEKTNIEKGYPPSVREIGEAVGLSSTASVYAYIKHLKEAGYLEKASNKGRALKVIKRVDGSFVEYGKKEDENQKKIVEIPLVDKVFVGEPVVSEDNISDTFPLPTDFVGDSETFMLTVKGDSMVDAGILNGDYVFVNNKKKIKNGDKVAVLIMSKVEIRTYYKENGEIRLQLENKEMEQTVVKKFEILGKVIGVFRKM